MPVSTDKGMGMGPGSPSAPNPVPVVGLQRTRVAIAKTAEAEAMHALIDGQVSVPAPRFFLDAYNTDIHTHTISHTLHMLAYSPTRETLITTCSATTI